MCWSVRILDYKEHKDHLKLSSAKADCVAPCRLQCTGVGLVSGMAGHGPQCPLDSFSLHFSAFFLFLNWVGLCLELCLWFPGYIQLQPTPLQLYSRSNTARRSKAISTRFRLSSKLRRRKTEGPWSGIELGSERSLVVCTLSFKIIYEFPSPN